jgi:hypothetical protein
VVDRYQQLEHENDNLRSIVREFQQIVGSTGLGGLCAVSLPVSMPLSGVCGIGCGWRAGGVASREVAQLQMENVALRNLLREVSPDLDIKSRIPSFEGSSLVWSCAPSVSGCGHAAVTTCRVHCTTWLDDRPLSHGSCGW